MKDKYMDWFFLDQKPIKKNLLNKQQKIVQNLIKIYYKDIFLKNFENKIRKIFFCF